MAAQIARIDSSRCTPGEWIKVSSGENRADNLIGDVTIPARSDSLVVWFRLEGKNAQGVKVCFDSLELEELPDQ